jgi:hypothetical protein
MSEEIAGLLQKLGESIAKVQRTTASGIWEKRGMRAGGKFYATGDSAQWRAWDAYLQSRGKPGAIRDRDGGWWFPAEWPPGYEARP